MLWGTFTAAHIVSLLCAVGLTVGLHFLLRRLSDRRKIAVLFVLSFAGIAAVVFNLVTWGSPLEYLPLHMCSIHAMLLPVTVGTRHRVLGMFSLFCCLGAALALIVNTGQAHFEILSPTFAFYYFPHVLEAAVPILLFTTGLIRPEGRAIAPTVLLTVLVYTAVHFANLGINAYAAAEGLMNWAGEPLTVNYMFSLSPEGNPMLAFFLRCIPYPYWYMYAAVPLLAVYLLAVWGIARLASRRKKGGRKALPTPRTYAILLTETDHSSTPEDCTYERSNECDPCRV